VSRQEISEGSKTAAVSAEAANKADIGGTLLSSQSKFFVLGQQILRA
jgi:hypothetical protein